MQRGGKTAVRYCESKHSEENRICIQNKEIIAEQERIQLQLDMKPEGDYDVREK